MKLAQAMDTDVQNETPNPNDSPSISRRRMLQAAAALTILPAGETCGGFRDAIQPLKRPLSTASSLKRQATHDYRHSLARLGGQLTSPPEQLRRAASNCEMLDVVIIGSGYGGAITAARISETIQPGSRVAMLERGREWIPGTFPDTLPSVLKEIRHGFFGSKSNERLRNQFGLFEYTYNDDLNVLTGSGLGGTSLINANVAAIPDPAVLARESWPAALRDLEQLKPYYDLARYELNIQKVMCETPKSQAYRRIAECVARNGGTVYPTDVAVAIDAQTLSHEGRNRQGMIQRPCTLCGDCTTGCNVGAKNTVQMNYLPLARQNGVEMYTQTEVDRIEKTETGYLVYFQQHSKCGNYRKVSCGSVHARIVILAAGSLGSSAILLRSQEHGLSLTDNVGRRFSGNGNVIGIMVKGCQPSNSAGIGAYDSGLDPIGLAQQTNLDLRHYEHLEHQLMIQEGVVPRAYASLTGAMLHDVNLKNTLLFLATGHDAGDGRLVLKDGRPRVEWPHHSASGYRDYARSVVQSLAPIGGGEHRQLAISGDIPSTVHPLGGCSMADNPCDGVVTDAGEVFDSRPQNDQHTHQGLYVADGSIIPTSLGANPFFTIAALSERVADKLISNPQFADLFPKAA